MYNSLLIIHKQGEAESGNTKHNYKLFKESSINQVDCKHTQSIRNVNNIMFTVKLYQAQRQEIYFPYIDCGDVVDRFLRSSQPCYTDNFVKVFSLFVTTERSITMNTDITKTNFLQQHVHVQTLKFPCYLRHQTAQEIIIHHLFSTFKLEQ